MNPLPLDLLIRILSTTGPKTSSRMVAAIPQLVRLYWQELRDAGITIKQHTKYTCEFRINTPIGPFVLSGEVGFEWDADRLMIADRRDGGHCTIDWTFCLPGRITRARFSYLGKW